MAENEKLRFYINDIKNLEFLEIRKILREHHYVPYKLDISQGAEKLIAKFTKLKRDYTVVFVGWQLGRRPCKLKVSDKNEELTYPVGCKIIRRQPEVTMLEQVLSLLKINPTREQKLIIANSKRGTDGMYRLLARKSEIEDIRFREMSARGLKQKDYDLAAEDFKKGVIKYGLYEIETEKRDYKDLILDHIFWGSRGRPKVYDALIVYRDGSGIEYIGDEVMAFRLFNEFRGLYDGSKEWHCFDADVEEVKHYLHLQYSAD